MKRLNIALSTLFLANGLVYAGGDIIEPVFEMQEEIIAEEQVPVEVVTPPPPPVLKEIVPLGLYVAAGLSLARYNPDCSCPMLGNVDKTAGVIGRLGYDFNQYMGVEARGIRTNWSSEGGKLKHAGAFVKPMYPVSEDVNLYALAGYAKTVTEGGNRRYTNAEAFAWGAGLEYDLGTDTPKEGRYSRAFDGYGDQEGGWGLFADYERLVQKSGSPDFDTLNVGITYDF